MDSTKQHPDYNLDFDTRLAKAKAVFDARDHKIREFWVKTMEAKIVRDELDKCHRAEGVNHYENCKWLSELYLNKLEQTRSTQGSWKKIAT